MDGCLSLHCLGVCHQAFNGLRSASSSEISEPLILLRTPLKHQRRLTMPRCLRQQRMTMAVHFSAALYTALITSHNLDRLAVRSERRRWRGGEGVN